MIHNSNDEVFFKKLAKLNSLGADRNLRIDINYKINEILNVLNKAQDLLNTKELKINGSDYKRACDVIDEADTLLTAIITDLKRFLND